MPRGMQGMSGMPMSDCHDALRGRLLCCGQPAGYRYSRRADASTNHKLEHTAGRCLGNQGFGR